MVGQVVSAWTNMPWSMDSSSPTNNVLRLSIPHLQVVHLAHHRLCGGILIREQLECYYKEDTLVAPSNHFLVTKKIIKIIIKKKS